MNAPAALISTALGAAFFSAGLAFYYQPSLLKPDFVLDAILTTNHSKARAAVIRLLFNPSSAQFDVLRTVQMDTEKYVCGNVKARDRSGAHTGYRAFVYTVAIDFARIDDDEEIAQRHDAFRACPLSEEEKLAQQKAGISPGALSMLKTIQKAIPAGDTSTLSNMASQMSPAGGQPSGMTTEQQLGHLAGQPGQNGSGGLQQSGSAFKAATDGESKWRGDRPPSAWPVFPPEHPLAKPVQKRTPAQAIALAKDVEDRWIQAKARASRKPPPTLEEVREALRGLMAINPRSKEFTEAWAIFVRLRKIEREAGAG
jgi:hypothetical protein